MFRPGCDAASPPPADGPAHVVQAREAIRQQLLGPEQVVQVGAARRCGRCSSRSVGSIGPASARNRALRMLIRPVRVKSAPFRPEAGLQHAVEHVDAVRDALEQVLGRADAHHVARLFRRQARRGYRQHLVEQRPSARRRESPPMAYPGKSSSTRSARRSRAAARRTSRPGRCRTAPDRRGGARRRAALRPAGASARTTARASAPVPDRACIRRAPWRCRTPSSSWIAHHALRCEAVRGAVEVRPECTPSSSSPRRWPRLKTWKPPLSVRIGPVPGHEAVQAAERRAISSDPGRRIEVVCVAEHDLRAGPRAAHRA